jgi:protein ImuB
MLKRPRQQLQLFAEPVAEQVSSASADIFKLPASAFDDLSDQPSQCPTVRNLWLCIRFPELALHAVASPHNIPAAVFTDEQGRALVYACNVKAEEVGITRGMSVNAALALLPALDIRQRQLAAEERLLQALANWALNYTPVVSVDITGMLLLEIRGSLHLFGGIHSLRIRLSSELRSWGHCIVMASAPMAKAARWLARANVPVDCTALYELSGALRNLPLACLDWPVSVQQQLLQMGVRSLGDCMRLPRDGFARRIGRVYLQDLDQGFGRYPELLHYYRSPETFHTRLELVADILTVDDIWPAMEELFDRLSVFLRQRQMGAQQLDVQFFHHGRDPTAFAITVREICTSITHLSALCRLQLDRLIIPAPVTALSLRASIAVVQNASADDLLRKIPLGAVVGELDKVSYERVIRFIEQLRARLGSQRVYGLNVVAEHRPEYAWAKAEPCSKHMSPVPGELINRSRPLWLHAQPLRLKARCNEPVQHGGVIPLGDVERIESGWWDGRDIRRDYYKAVNHRGIRLWIYRDCRNSGWYLHGLFA